MITTWQPMTSALRDETEVLLLTTTGIVSAWWAKPIITDSYFDGKDVEGCEWVCYDAAFTIQVEWWINDADKDEFCDDSAGVLGWMPIPNHENLLSLDVIS